LRLKVITLNNYGATERYCELEEARTWDYSDQLKSVNIDGIQISSYEELAEIIDKQKNKEEIEVYITPPIIAGG
jgi:hypothetical protein